MKFIYALLYAIFNGNQQLPVYNASNQKKCFAKLFLPIGVMLVLAMSLPRVGFATTYNWKGTTSKNWNTKTNWSPVGLPAQGDDVIIPASATNYPTVPAGVTTPVLFANNITINATSGTVITIPAGFVLSIGGTITTNGGLIDARFGTINMAGSAPQSIGGSYFVSSTVAGFANSNLDIVSGVTISDSFNITGELTLDDGSDYSILTTNNNLTLVSNASGTAIIEPVDEDPSSGVPIGSIAGNVTVERYYPANRRWRLVTAPVQSSGAPTISAAWQEGGQSIAGSVSNPNPGFGTHITGPGGAFVASTGYDQSPTNNPSIGHLMGSNSWYTIPNTTSTSVTAYQGYMLFVRGDRSYPIYTTTSTTLATSTVLRTTGTLNIGQVSVPVNSGFTVIGNPYAATLNFNSVFANNASAFSNNNSYSLWDPNIGSANNVANGTGGWVTLTTDGLGDGGYIAVPNPDTNGFDTSGEIQSGAAFIVEGAAAGSVVIDESDKISDGTDGDLYLFRPTGSPVAQVSTLRTTLYSTDTANAYIADGALNMFSTSYTNDVNWSKDVKKLFGLNERLFIVKNGQNIAIERSAPPQAGDTVYLNVGSLNVSPYKLVIATNNFTRTDIKAFLIDSFDSTSTPILLGDTSVTLDFAVTAAPASYAANRFSIVFTATPPATVTYSNVTATAVQNKNIAVQWQVTNQTNTKDYVVEKSTDGTHFTVVDTTAATPTDVSSYTYNWTDTNAVVGTNYYRIYTIGDNLAIQDTSNVASAVIDAGIIAPVATAVSLIKVYPNPVTNGTVNVDLTNLPAGNYGIKIISTTGDVLLSETTYHGLNAGPITIPFGQGVSAGVYILEIIDTNGNKTKVTFENQ
jgi:hypothetical protein